MLCEDPHASRASPEGSCFPRRTPTARACKQMISQSHQAVKPCCTERPATESTERALVGISSKKSVEQSYDHANRGSISGIVGIEGAGADVCILLSRLWYNHFELPGERDGDSLYSEGCHPMEVDAQHRGRVAPDGSVPCGKRNCCAPAKEPPRPGDSAPGAVVCYHPLAWVLAHLGRASGCYSHRRGYVIAAWVARRTRRKRTMGRLQDVPLLRLQAPLTPTVPLSVPRENRVSLPVLVKL